MAVSQIDDLNYHYTAEDLMEAGKKLCGWLTGRKEGMEGVDEALKVPD